MASPLTLSHCPICRSLSSKTGMITPSAVGPTLIRMLPPKLHWTQKIFLNSVVQDKDNLCQVWLKLGLKFWRKRLLNVVNLFLLLSLFHLKKNDIPYTQGWLVEICKGFLEKIFFKTVNEFLLYHNYLHLFIWTNLN